MPKEIATEKRYTDLNRYFRNMYGCRVQKISIDAGLTCPNRDGTLSRNGCIYCNQRGSGTGNHIRGLSITEQIRRGMATLATRYRAKKFIAYFQSFTNTYAPIGTLKKLYDEALAFKDVVGLSIGTRPDCVDAMVLELLGGYAKHRLVWIEYGLQSVHDRTLAAINRGHDFRCFKNAVNMTRKYGLNICTHVILGLPDETRRQMLDTAERLAGMDIQGIKVHLLYVVKGTQLETMYRQGRYRCLEQGEYVDLVCDFLERLPASFVIQRLTGDPHPHELVAPQWSLDKAKTRNLIDQTLVNRASWQGKYFSRRKSFETDQSI